MDEHKYLLLDYINELGSIRAAANELSFSYRTALNYIKKMESSLNVSVIETHKGEAEVEEAPPLQKRD